MSLPSRMRISGRTGVIAIPFFWYFVLFLIPFVIVLKISFSEVEIGVPPYTKLTEFTDGMLTIRLSVAKYWLLLTDSIYIQSYLNSLKMALLTTLFCLLIGYPMAYYIARSSPVMRNALMMMVMLPFWTSFLIRVYAWIGLLKNNGLINNFLMWLGVIDEPLPMYHTNFGVQIGMVYSYLPFMLMPLYAHLVKMDLTLLEAAYDLGAKPMQAFFRITIPLSKNGIIAGCLLVFIPAVGEFVIPDLLGGANTLMLGHVLWDEFFGNTDWPMASAVTVVMVILLLVPMALFHRYGDMDAEGAVGGRH